MHQETIHLRFGERISAFLLDRVLSRHNNKQFRHLVRRACDRDLALLHRFEQRCLHLRGSAINLVRQDDIRENWAGFESKLVLSACSVQHLSSGNVGRQQVGRELDP